MKANLQLMKTADRHFRWFVKLVERVERQVQEHQVGRVLEQQLLDGVYLVVTQVEPLQLDRRVLIIVLDSLEDLGEQVRRLDVVVRQVKRHDVGSVDECVRLDAGNLAVPAREEDFGVRRGELLEIFDVAQGHDEDDFHV